jgi:hypothetical protein
MNVAYDVRLNTMVRSLPPFCARVFMRGSLQMSEEVYSEYKRWVDIVGPTIRMQTKQQSEYMKYYRPIFC